MILRENVHIYPSPFTNESRILRFTKSLAANKVFDKIYIIAGYKKGLEKCEKIDEIRTVFRIKPLLGNYEKGGIHKLLFLVFWTFQGFWKMMGKNLVCIDAHSVATLPMAFLLKKIHKKSRIIYDAHEIETETVGKSGMMKKIAVTLEKRYIQKVDAMTIDGDGRAEWYRRKYNIDNVHPIKNYPYKRIDSVPSQSLLRKHFDIPADHILFIHQGMFGQGRGVEKILQAFANTKESNHIVFLGSGELTPVIQEYEKKFSHIHWHKAVPPNEVWSYTTGADVGIHIIENTCLNHYICLPNKVLEYLNAKIPIIISDFPEMASLVDNYNCGWKIQPDSASLLHLIEQISLDDIIEKKKNAALWPAQNSWEDEEKKLLQMFRNLLS